MELDQKNVNLEIKHPWRKLSEEDAYAWAKTEALAELEEEGENGEPFIDNIEPSQERVFSSERLLRMLSCFGIFDKDEKSIIIARSAIEHLACGIAIRRVFTRPAFRNQGYGRSITSVAVEEATKKNGKGEKILLFVIQTNASAKRIYQVIGFRTVGSRTEYELVPST